MLTRIEIDGFKSFTNFSMEFSPLTIIAGLNASGKSNLFDALHLLSLLAEFDLNTAFDKVQRGRNLELFTQYADGRYAEEMRFVVEVELDGGINLVDSNKPDTEYVRYFLSIRRQLIANGVESVIVVREGVGLVPEWEPDIHETAALNELKDEFGEWDGRALMKYFVGRENRTDTILSLTNKAKQEHVDPNLLHLQQEISSWKLLHLDPQKLSLATPAQAFGLPGTLNAAADNLAGVLWRLEKTDAHLVKRIAQRVAALVPGIKAFEVTHYEYGGVYEVWVHTTAGQRFPLRLLSEGTLRMLALVTLVFDPEQKGVLGLEEVENGVHPARLAGIAELLHDLSSTTSEFEAPLRQVIVNTHSPGLVKACLAAVAAEGKADGLTVWFSQLVSRTVTEDGKRTSRRVTEMLPVLLPNVPSELSAETVAALDSSQKQFALYQLIRYLESADPDTLLDQLDLSTPPPSAA